MATATPNRLDEPLDTTVRLTTPERIVFQYPVAGPFRRFMAYLIDVVCLLLILFLLAILIGIAFGLLGAGGVGAGLILIATLVLVWGYGAFCEGVFNGQTLGKLVLGIRVISDQGVPITGAQAIIRNLVGALDGPWPFVYVLGFSSMLLTKKFQRLGDLAAGTMVIVEQRRRRSGVILLREPEVLALLPWLPIRIAAGTEMARALSEYVKYRGRIGRALREEMAEHLAAPLRVRYALPEKTPADTILCAVYHRVFVGE